MRPVPTPLSPMLANVALTALDEYCHEKLGTNTSDGIGKYIQNPLVRYADDFVIVCKTKAEAKTVKEEITTVLEGIGLELSEEKTIITHISDGFDFLGFNLRKYYQKSPKSKYHGTGILLIKPQKEKAVKVTRKMQETLDSNKTAKQASIIHKLNPIIQGYGMYASSLQR